MARGEDGTPDGNLAEEGEKSNQSHTEGPKVVIAGLDGLKPVLRTYKFTLDFNVFNDLVEAMYRQISKADGEYSRNISMGMFSYYCGMALWYRLYAIKHAQGGDDSWCFPVLKLALCDELVLPKPFCEFLDLIGDFTEPNEGFYWKLVFPGFNREGHFGKMSKQSFYKYMAYPAPAVLVETLRRELNMILKKIEPLSEWKLKELDHVSVPQARLFTKNVCGYYVPPNASMFEMRVDGKICKQLSDTFDEASSRNMVSGFLAHENLITYITEYNANEVSEYPMQKYTNESKYGSVVQMGFVESCTVDGDDEGGKYFSGDVIGYSPVMLPSSLANLIPVFRLRARRTSRVEAYPYDFDSVDDIPTGWSEKLNTYFDFEDAKASGWNFGKFATASVDSKRAVSEYVSSFIKTA